MITCDLSFSVLIQAGADLDKQDLDGWTALHAAAHWGQKDAARILVENLCSMDIKNIAVSVTRTTVF